VKKSGFILSFSALAYSLILAAPLSAQMDAPVKDGATLKDDRDDTAITTKVKAALTNDKYTSGATDAIHVQTDGGVVTLTGDVASQATAVHAQTLVAQLTGVRDVVNDRKYPHPANGVTSSPIVARLQPRTNRNRKSRICARSSI
jgi:osmotically-inducible protein OsmY